MLCFEIYRTNVLFIAEMLQRRLGDKCPKIIRVYSEMLENQVFPIPRDSAQIGSRRDRRFELIDKDEHHDISLHHLIRKEGNPKYRELRAFDRKFERCIRNKKLEDVSDEDVRYLILACLLCDVRLYIALRAFLSDKEPIRSTSPNILYAFSCIDIDFTLLHA